MADMRITIRRLHGENKDITLSIESKVLDLKERITSLLKIPLVQQRLIYKGKVLENSKKLTDYGVADGHVVHLVIREQERTPTSSTPSGSSSFTRSRDSQRGPPSSSSSTQQPRGNPLLEEGLGGLPDALAHALAHSFQAIGVQDHFPPQGQGTGTNTASDQRGDRGGDATGQEESTEVPRIGRLERLLHSALDGVKHYETQVERRWNNQPPIPTPATSRPTPSQSSSGSHGDQQGEGAEGSGRPIPSSHLSSLLSLLNRLFKHLLPLLERHTELQSVEGQLTGEQFTHYEELKKAINRALTNISIVCKEVTPLPMPVNPPPPHTHHGRSPQTQTNPQSSSPPSTVDTQVWQHGPVTITAQTVTQPVPIQRLQDIQGIPPHLLAMMQTGGPGIIPFRAPIPNIPGLPPYIYSMVQNAARSNRPAPPPTSQSDPQTSRDGAEEEESNSNREEGGLRLGPEQMAQYLENLQDFSTIFFSSLAQTRRDPRTMELLRSTFGDVTPEEIASAMQDFFIRTEHLKMQFCCQTFRPRGSSSVTDVGLSTFKSLTFKKRQQNCIFRRSKSRKMILSKGGNATLADVIPIDIEGREYGLLMELIVHGSQGISVREFQSILQENEEGLPNLRPHLLNFLRDKVLHGRQPNQENKKEIVDFLVNNFQPQLANCWSNVQVLEGINFQASIRKCLNCEIEELITLIITNPTASESRTIGAQILAKGEAVVATIAALARVCIIGDEEYFKEEVLLKAFYAVFLQPILDENQSTPFIHNLLRRMSTNAFLQLVNQSPDSQGESLERYIIRTAPPNPSPVATLVAPCVDKVSAKRKNDDQVTDPQPSNGEASNSMLELPSDIPAAWIPVLQRDKELLEHPQPVPTFSDAYVSTTPAKKRKVATSQPMSVPEVFARVLENAIDEAEVTSQTGKSSRDVAEEVTQNVELCHSFSEEMNSATRQRVVADKEFSPEKYPLTKAFYKL